MLWSRDALVTSSLAATLLLTPDGRLGLVFAEATQVRFIAVGERRRHSAGERG